MLMLAMLAVAAAQPSAEALRLGQEIARAGTLAALLPMIKDGQLKEVVEAHPELSAAEKTLLARTGERVFRQGVDKLMDSQAHAYAANLSLADLRAAAAYYRTPAAARMRAALPKVIGAGMQAMAGMDFKKDLSAAFCRETGKLCAAQ